MWLARNRMMSSLHAAARPVSRRSLAVATLLAEQHWEEPIDGGMPADEAFLKYAGVYVKGFHVRVDAHGVRIRAAPRRRAAMSHQCEDANYRRYDQPPGVPLRITAAERANGNLVEVDPNESVPYKSLKQNPEARAAARRRHWNSR